MSEGALLEVSEARRQAVARVLAALEAAQRIVLTTHVHADGDGAGSEAALAAWLVASGREVTIVNPTPFPDLYRYLLGDPAWVADAGTPEADAALAAADLVVVLDTSEPKRLGRVAKAVQARPRVVIDHHQPVAEAVTGTDLQDPQAAAAGELVYDLLLAQGSAIEPWPKETVEGLYVAIMTDTGSFRFSNTTPRVHLIAADLLRRGVDPETVYRRVFATMTLARIRLLRDALHHLECDAELPISWISIPAEVMERNGATSEDLEGLVEYARSLEGTEVALLFRELDARSTKISFRSSGLADVNALARALGGGGHVKAAGALVGEPLGQVRERVLQATREHVRALSDATGDA
jgi:bifunctional oligoribonuclease and PAP phosphatase NrnA